MLNTFIKVIFFCVLFTLNFDFSRLTFDFFLSSPHLLCLKAGSFHYRTAKCKDHEKGDRLLISKMDLIIRLPSEIKDLHFDPISQIGLVL